MSKAPQFGRDLYRFLHERLHLPWAYSVALVRAAKTAARPVEHARRRSQAARLLREPSDFKNKISESRGVWVFDPDELPGAKAAASACAKLFDERFSQESSAPPDGTNRKKHLRALIPADELAQNDAILQFALSRPLLEAATSYFGSAPVLSAISLFLTTKNSSQISSQLFHLDGEDVTQLKLFVNVWDTGEQQGPFTTLTAARTSELLGQVDRKKRLNRGDMSFDDDFVLSGTGEDQIVRFTGKAGSGGFVDTSRCLHYGSRGNAKERLVLMIKYTPFNSARESATSFRSSDWVPAGEYDDLQRLALRL